MWIDIHTHTHTALSLLDIPFHSIHLSYSHPSCCSLCIPLHPSHFPFLSFLISFSHSLYLSHSQSPFPPPCKALALSSFQPSTIAAHHPPSSPPSLSTHTSSTITANKTTNTTINTPPLNANPPPLFSSLPSPLKAAKGLNLNSAPILEEAEEERVRG